MSLQRWTLRFPPGSRVRTKCGEMSRAMCWTLSVALYGVSNGVYQSSLAMAPISLCTSLFTLVLVWNIFIARKLLGEVPSRVRLLGAMVTIAGVVVSVLGVPQKVCNEFQLPHVKYFTRQLTGLVTLLSLVGLMVTVSVFYLCYEMRYSILDPPAEQRVMTDDKQPDKKRTPKPKPPRRLDSVMAVVAPISLGLQEGLGGVVAKNLFSVFFYQAFHEFMVPFTDPYLWAWLCGCMTTVASLAFLKMIYARYETTRALPIEYGTVHLCQLLSGVFYYREFESMSKIQFILAFSGLGIVLCGVIISSAGATGGGQSTAPMDAVPTTPATQVVCAGAPVQTTGDQLALMSDAYQVTPDFRMTLAGACNGVPPSIQLDDVFVNSLLSLVPNGPPSLIACSKLTVEGRLSFAAGVVFKGDVKVVNKSDESKVLAAGTYADTTVEL